MSRPRSLGAAAFFLAGACFCVAGLFDEDSRTLFIGVGASQMAVGAAILSTASRKADSEADENDGPLSSP